VEYSNTQTDAKNCVPFGAPFFIAQNPTPAYNPPSTPMPQIKTKPKPTTATQPYFEIRASGIHGSGAFALRPIPKGTRLIEYIGEYITYAEADRRATDADNDSHTFFFTLNRRTVIDAGVGGNEARFINHSCAPNCVAETQRGHIYIETLRDIAPGEELVYDYELEIDAPITRAQRERFACHCGSPNCRGTMLLLKRSHHAKKAKAK
jgi:hypothetical protein